MERTSAIPGRLRLQCSALHKKPSLCRHVEHVLVDVDGILDVSASHRIGRLLVLYDTTGTDEHRLLGVVDHTLRQTLIRYRSDGGLQPLPFRSREAVNGVPRFGALAREAALIGIKSMIPAPWNRLFSVAEELMKRQR